VLVALGQSVSFGAAFREALPWLVLTAPVCVALAPAAVFARGPGIVGDACLAASFAWSLPETIDNARHGDLLAAVVIAAVATLPFAAAGRRDVRFLTVAVAAVAFGTLALVAGPVLRGTIHS
jgi:hypothetical protein